jgi:Domain of unknown function (DUF4387)
MSTSEKSKPMTELWEVAKLIRSKNAGPWELTIDIMFGDQADYDWVAASNIAEPETYARIYHLPASDIRVFKHEMALALKVSLPRPTPAGGLQETDVFGGQFGSPLVHLTIESERALEEQKS